MGKRYHCDYCDKTFPDSAGNRKKHLQGTYHMRMKKLHYDAFLDAASVLKVRRVLGASFGPFDPVQCGFCVFEPVLGIL
ncbi:hypothetical protein HPB48_022047 [Haemaphysalis longicornis]|uniref:U1-C C2H2-type zinc finger domain-containing protein n=1 Tax=Haemaphysalis longicornis TaxID=44386 RepID=A0A9J6G8H5_HAELO|nr:hypothetical protein HPB48_022047 [Haemaphysalis longicornis]